MTDPRVFLNPHEVDMAAAVGMRRNLSAMKAGKTPQHGCPPDDLWRVHIEGACGELAVAKFLGRYWDGSVDTFRAIPDLVDAEIRTRSRHHYDLIVRKDDNPNQVFILVTGRTPGFWVRGWIRGTEARRDEWWQDHGGRGGAWFVPADALRSDWPVSTNQRNGVTP